MEGEIIGVAKSVIELLTDLGDVSEDVKNVILKQRNPDVLKNWLKCAAKAKDHDDWKKQVGW